MRRLLQLLVAFTLTISVAMAQTPTKPSGAVSISTTMFRVPGNDSLYLFIPGVNMYYNLGIWPKINSDVASKLNLKVDKTTTVNGHPLSSNVTVTKGDVGLGNVDNTTDLNKPVSTATQTALNLKENAANKSNTALGTSTTLFPTQNSVKTYVDAAISANTGASNLAVGTRTTTTLPITNSNGTGVTLPIATTTLAGLQSSADKTKLDGIATGATANQSDAFLLARANHTGVQAISTVTGLQTALDSKIDLTQKGAVNGVATLGSDGKIPNGQIPAIALTETFVVANQAAMLALSAERGDVAVRTDLQKSFILQQEPAATLGNWVELLSPSIANTDQVPEGSTNLYFTTPRARASVSAGSGIGYNSSTGVISNTSPNVQSNLALGTRTTTTLPITNSDGTGVTLPIATTSLAGLQSSADKTKLDAITGTNTGNQTLSVTSPGEISISSGNTINVRDVALHGTTDFPDANTLPTGAGFYPYTVTTGATNYPSGAGAGFKVLRGDSSGAGYFEFYKEAAGNNTLYFRNGTGTSSFGAWDIVAGRDWANTQFAPISGGAYLPLTGGALTGGLIGTTANFTTSLQTPKIGVGVTPSTSVSIYNLSPITGGATAYGQLINSLIQSDVTTNAFGYRSIIGTQAASFTLTNLFHNKVEQGTIGSGSSVDLQVGYDVSNNLTGAGENIGFRSSLPIAANNWNIRISGGAQNYMNGSLGLGVLTPTEKLDVVGNGKFSGNLTSANSYSTTSTTTGSGNNILTVQQTGTIISSGAGTLLVNNHSQSSNMTAGNALLVKTNGKDAFRVNGLGNTIVDGTITSTGVISTDSELYINGVAGSDRIARFMTGNVTRWSVYANAVSESGSNAGSDFNIARYSDGGSSLGTALSINRSTGNSVFSGTITAAGASINGQVNIQGSVSANNLASGTYTPTSADLSGITTVTPNKAMWTRVGNIVTVSGRITVDQPAVTGIKSLTLTLPIASSISAYDISGRLNSININMAGTIVSSSSGKALLAYTDDISEVSGATIQYTFTYEVL